MSQNLLPPRLLPLFDQSVAVRKAGARNLVGKVQSSDRAMLLQRLTDEVEPEVLKWLAMALARARASDSLPIIRQKYQACADENARDWLIAAEAVLQPLTSAHEAQRRVESSEVFDQRGGTILAWGARGIDDKLVDALLRFLSISDNPGLRRWATLALHQHRVSIDASVLLESIAGKDVLLREWSLHVLRSQPNPRAYPTVRDIVMKAPVEHPRVVEWAVRALPSLNASAETMCLIIDVFCEVSDPGVQEACVIEVAAHLSDEGAEFLSDLLARTDNPLLAVGVLRGLSSRLNNAPRKLLVSLDTAISRLEGSATLIALATGVWVPEALTTQQQLLLQSAKGDPVVRMALRIGEEDAQDSGGKQMNTGKKSLVAGVVIALEEEFDYYVDTLPSPVTPHISSNTGATYYLHDIDVPSGKVNVAVRCTGHKGGDHAAIAATQLLTEYSPALIVNIGISGSLHEDATLGAVVVGDAVSSWAANSRIEDDKVGGGFSFLLAGEPFRSDKWLADRATGLKRESPTLFAEWTAFMTSNSSNVPGGVTISPNVLRGDLAAGPFVAASAQFKAWLLGHKRDYLAIDMESSGVASAAWSDAVKRTRLLVLRGISDPADAGKSALEKSTKGVVRQLAMRAASKYLTLLLRHLAQVGVPQ